MERRIESAGNPLAKELKALKDKKGREALGAFLAEGEKLVAEALRYRQVKQLIVSDEYTGALLEEAGETERIFMPKRIFDAICETRSPQGVAAVVEIDEPALHLPEEGIVVLLEQVQDPGNVGTMLRTADAVGAAAVLLGPGCADIYNPKVVRSAMGSLFHLPIYQNVALKTAAEALATAGFELVAGHLGGENRLPNLGRKAGVLIGNESRGLSDELTALATVRYKLPMVGKAESLNASVACGIILYDVLRAGRFE